MKSFQDHITEATGVKEKGWAHKSGKLVMSRIRPPYYPYHLQMVVMKPKLFGTTEAQLKKYVKDNWDTIAHGSPKNMDAKIDVLWDKAVSGRIDREHTIEEFILKKGWARVVIDDGNGSIQSAWMTERQMHKIAKSLDKKYGSHAMFPESSAYFEFNGNQFSEQIHNRLDWEYYIRTGKYNAPRRSEIGRTLAQFREEEERKSFMEYIMEAKKWILTMLQVGDIVTYVNGVEAKVMDISDLKGVPGFMSVHMKITHDAGIAKKGFEFWYKKKKPGKQTGMQVITKVVRKGKEVRL